MKDDTTQYEIDKARGEWYEAQEEASDAARALYWAEKRYAVAKDARTIAYKRLQEAKARA